MSKENADEAKKWYKNNVGKYKRLSQKVEALIEEIFDIQGIKYNIVSSRTKDVESFYEKAMKEKYSDPKEQIKDLSGIRIIAYVNSDVDKICKIIKENFEIDKDNSINKSEQLGVDKVGYRSVHYVATFKEERLKLPEYQQFKYLYFEIQVRSILQHAWAEIEHDRNYKFHGVLPEHLKRRFFLVAGVLELADKEFDSIAKDIDTYANHVSININKGNLDNILIDSTSLEKYMINFCTNNEYLREKNFDFGLRDGIKEIIEELSDFGIETLQELNNIIPPDLSCFENSNENFLSLLRTFMIIQDANKYFEYCWKSHWKVFEITDINFYKKFDIDIFDLANKYDIDIV